MGDMSISEIKQLIEQHLGRDGFNQYLMLLRDWFGERLDKDMLDYEVFSLFDEKGVELHNLLMHTVLQESATDKNAVGGPQRNSFQMLPVPDQTTLPTIITVDGTTYSMMTPEGTFPLQVHQDASGNNVYIVPTGPAEGAFTYPSYIRDFPDQPEIEGAEDVMEQDPPPDCDWLQEVKVTYPADETMISEVDLKNRFPPWFAHDYQRVNTNCYANVNMVRNVTHFLTIQKDILERKPHLKQHFVIPGDPKAPYLTCGASLYGRILTQAWTLNIQHVNLNVVEYAVKAVREQINTMIKAIIKQRRPFRMREKRIMHSMGVPYPNPYLRQGFHMYDEAYSSDTTKMADVVMQVPSPYPTIEEKERLSALQLASSYSGKEGRFNPAKGTMMDFKLAIENDLNLIPTNKLRMKVEEQLLRKNKGFSGSQNAVYSGGSEEDLDDFTSASSLSNPPQVLPLASY